MSDEHVSQAPLDLSRLASGWLRIALVGAGAGVFTLPLAADAAAPTFSPLSFFAGRTEGNGVLHRIASRAKAVHVLGTGTAEGNSSIELVQQVEVAGKPSRERRWHLRDLGSGRYTGTLSEAVGPVAGDVAGNVFHVRFRLKGGFGVQQWMRLQPGGRVVLNHLVVRKFGIRVASLDETIRKLP